MIQFVSSPNREIPRGIEDAIYTCYRATAQGPGSIFHLLGVLRLVRDLQIFYRRTQY